MATLKKKIAAYANMRSDLETEHLGEWALIHDEELISMCSADKVGVVG